jgi:type I restriction enzyme S subunit
VSKNDKVQHLRNEPRLRFKEFSYKYTGDYLGIFIKYITEKTNLGIGDLYVSTENIHKEFNGLSPVSLLTSIRATKVSEKNILISNIRPYLKKLDIAGFNGGCSSDVLCFDTNFNNNKYFKYLMQNDNFINYVMDTSKGTKMPRGDKQSILKYNVCIPNILEQNKIGDFISKIDTKIYLMQSKLENLKLFKKGYKQRLYKSLESKNSIEIKMKDILCEVVKKTSYSNQYEVLSSTTSGVYKQSDYFKSEIASKDNTGYKILKRNQFVMSPQNAWMGNYNLNTEIEIGIVSPSYKVFDVDSSISKPLFAELIDTNRFRYDIICSSEQGASIVRRNLNLADFMDIKIKIPSDKTHLNAVESLLDRINDKIKHSECHLKTLKQFKKGLLQKMFV